MAARQHVENVTGRKLVTQTWRWTVDALAGEMTIPLSPVQSVSSVTYTDEAGDTQTLSSSLYDLDLTTNKPRIRPAPGEAWPDQQNSLGGAAITVVCGYGVPAAVPTTIKQAMLLLIGHFFENRQAVMAGGGVPMALPMGVDALLTPERNWWL